MYLVLMITQMIRCIYNAIKGRPQNNSLILYKRVEKRCNKNIQNIFLILDNLSAHKSKRYKKKYPNVAQE
jgi:hypothetical protein